jgi:non-specific serine/threonine protein kinase
VDLIGKTLSHYVILDQLGAGGMGVVYRARDERLDRDVAVKVLTPSLVADEAARKRLRREARLLSRLNHPNVNQIYDFDSQDGVDFLVMEFVRGETLSHRLRSACFAEPDVVSIGVQIAQALEEAHASGIVHRDLKPGNVMLTARGAVKVLDFGLAKALESDRVAMESLTEDGRVAGTLPYIAPEQFRGAPVDERSDIYALGALLYEIATGVRAFPQETAASLIDAVLHDPPPNPRTRVPEMSPALEAIILRSMEKDPARRPSTAGEVATELQGTGVTRVGSFPRRAGRTRSRTVAVTLAAVALLGLGYAFSPWLRGGTHAKGSGPIDALAVLPLDDLSGDPQQSYFADGMTDALITRLAQIGGLRVISRTSVMHYRGSGKTMRQDRQGAPRGLPSWKAPCCDRETTCGSVPSWWMHPPTGTSGRITYDRELGDVIELQRDLATAIAGQVHVQLTARERKGLEDAPRVDPAAYDEYLKGRHEWATRTRDGLERARRHFSSAAEIDPRFALAYSGLAEVYLLQDIYSGSRAEEALPRAEEAARKALEIDDQLGEAYPALGMVKLYRRWDWSGAEADFQRAIRLRPSYAHRPSLVLHPPSRPRPVRRVDRRGSPRPRARPALPHRERQFGRCVLLRGAISRVDTAASARS